MSGLAWGWPVNSKKAHVFEAGHSLCRRWIFLGTGDPIRSTEYTRGPDDCAVCARILAAHLKPSAKAGGGRS